MKQHTHHFRTLLVVAIVFMMAIPLSSYAATAVQPNVVRSASLDVFITEVQTGSLASGGEEFVELYNATGQDIDFSDSLHGGKDAWKLQYFLGSKFSAVSAGNAPSSAWTAPSGTINLTGTIPAHDYYILAGTGSNGGYAPGNIDADQTYSPHLSDDVALQLVDIPSTATFTYHDRLLWTSDPMKLTSNPALYLAPAAGSSLQRLPNDDLTYLSSTNVLTDFASKPVISPRAAWTTPSSSSDPTDTSPNDPTGPDGSDSPGTGTDGGTDVTPRPDLLAPKISELLPNPASPLMDASDEYIELYNPNDTPYDLAGMTLEGGETTKHDFTFLNAIIPAGGYAVYYSSTTGIPLSNSGGKVVLLDTTGKLVDASATYGTAADGQAWAYDPTTDAWKWTTTQTPGTVNMFTIPDTLAVATKKPATTKKTVSKVKGASTVKKAKTSKAKKAKKVKVKKSKTTAAPASYSAAATAPAAPVHTSVLAIVAALAVAYVIYEYRRDLANKIHQLRSHRVDRPRNRP